VRVGTGTSNWTTVYLSVAGAAPETDPAFYTETGTDRITVTVRDTVKTNSPAGGSLPDFEDDPPGIF
jgi:hypothetical protein